MQPDENFWKKCEGERIANAYELEQLLGCGAFGGVFRAVQIANGRKLNKRVAVKLMLSGTIQQEELNFALDLPSHQNLVQHFAGNNVEIRGFPMFYLVMELADSSLADFVKKRGGRISSVEAKAVVRDIAQGLKYLHELDAGNSEDKRYVHRDLKLLNVLQVGGVWKIADFGLSKALDRGTMQASKIAGTPYYMPPELFRNGYVSTKWDIWSFGVMILEMLTGHFPFEAVGNGNTEVMIKELERKIERENPNLQGVPSEWLDVVKGCLVKDHERRWTAADVLRALDLMVEPVTQNQPSTAPNSQTSSQKTKTAHARPSSAKGLWGTVITIGLISAVGFMIWQFVKPVNSPLIISFPFISKTATDFFSDGLKKYNEQNYEGAIADYNEAIRLKPDYAHAYYNRGIVKFALRDNQGAIADYNEAIQINPNYADAYYNRAVVKFAVRDKQGAINDYNEAIRINPNYADAYYNRAVVKSGLGDKQGAIADYNEVIRIKPSYATAYYSRGNVKSELGDKQGAIADYNEVNRFEPKFVHGFIISGNRKSELLDRQGAIADYNEAIRINPNYADAYNNRGLAKSVLEDKQGAITDYNEAIRLNPSSADAYNNRGRAKFALRDKQGAIADYNKVIRLNPNLIPAYNNRGLARSELGDKQGAIADYNEAIRLNPNYADAYYNRGDTYQNLGNKLKALVDFQAAARLYKQQGNMIGYGYDDVENRIRKLQQLPTIPTLRERIESDLKKIKINESDLGGQ